MNLKLSWAALFLVVSCISDVRFEEPQPEGLPDEQMIPKKLQGKYVSEEDSSLLQISKRFIIRKNDQLRAYSKSEFDSLDQQLPGKDTLLQIENLKYRITKPSDSTFLVHTFLSDTILNLSSIQKLRKFKGFYFINRQERDGTWVVQKINWKRRGLVIGSIRSKEEMLNLREITADQNDSTLVFSPSRKEFRKFLKDKNFGDEERFLKIN